MDFHDNTNDGPGNEHIELPGPLLASIAEFLAATKAYGIARAARRMEREE
jgi:hypothetical protein